jgi:hypothetical protein
VSVTSGVTVPVIYSTPQPTPVHTNTINTIPPQQKSTLSRAKSCQRPKLKPPGRAKAAVRVSEHRFGAHDRTAEIPWIRAAYQRQGWRHGSETGWPMGFAGMAANCTPARGGKLVPGIQGPVTGSPLVSLGSLETGSGARELDFNLDYPGETSRWPQGSGQVVDR